MTGAVIFPKVDAVAVLQRHGNAEPILARGVALPHVSSDLILVRGEGVDARQRRSSTTMTHVQIFPRVTFVLAIPSAMRTRQTAFRIGGPHGIILEITPVVAFWVMLTFPI